MHLCPQRRAVDLRSSVEGHATTGNRRLTAEAQHRETATIKPTLEHTVSATDSRTDRASQSSSAR